MLSEQIFKGPVDKMVREALSYIDSMFIQETVMKIPGQAEANRFFNYPYEAIEEALVNAVYHRDYAIREPVEVRILPTEITICSYSGPNRSISLDALQKRNFDIRTLSLYLKTTIDITQRIRTINIRLARAEQIEIRAV